MKVAEEQISRGAGMWCCAMVVRHDLAPMEGRRDGDLPPLVAQCDLTSGSNGVAVVVRFAVYFSYGNLARWRGVGEEEEGNLEASHNLIISKKEKNEE